MNEENIMEYLIAIMVDEDNILAFIMGEWETPQAWRLKKVKI